MRCLMLGSCHLTAPPGPITDDHLDSFCPLAELLVFENNSMVMKNFNH